jgi:flagellar M-ring protein FliF
LQATATNPAPKIDAPPTSASSVPPPSQSADNAATKHSETINYEISKSVRHTVEPVGTLKNVSVAVIIDNHTKVTTGANGKPQSSTEPRSPEEMKKYHDIVAAAVGFNAERGDKLTVENVSFEDESELVKEPTFIEKQGPLVLTGLRYVIIPIAFVLIYLLFLRPVKKVVFATLSAAGATGGQIGAGQMVKALPQAAGSRAQTPMTVKQLEAQIAGGAVEKAAAPAPDLGLDLAPLDARTKMEEIRDRVVERAKQDPENVARLVRVWLNDEKSK